MESYKSWSDVVAESIKTEGEDKKISNEFLWLFAPLCPLAPPGDDCATRGYFDIIMTLPPDKEIIEEKALEFEKKLIDLSWNESLFNVEKEEQAPGSDKKLYLTPRNSLYYGPQVAKVSQKNMNTLVISVYNVRDYSDELKDVILKDIPTMAEENGPVNKSMRFLARMLKSIISLEKFSDSMNETKEVVDGDREVELLKIQNRMLTDYPEIGNLRDVYGIETNEPAKEYAWFLLGDLKKKLKTANIMQHIQHAALDIFSDETYTPNAAEIQFEVVRSHLTRKAIIEIEDGITEQMKAITDENSTDPIEETATFLARIKLMELEPELFVRSIIQTTTLKASVAKKTFSESREVVRKLWLKVLNAKAQKMATIGTKTESGENVLLQETVANEETIPQEEVNSEESELAANEDTSRQGDGNSEENALSQGTVANEETIPQEEVNSEESELAANEDTSRQGDGNSEENALSQGTVANEETLPQEEVNSEESELAANNTSSQTEIGLGGSESPLAAEGDLGALSQGDGNSGENELLEGTILNENTLPQEDFDASSQTEIGLGGSESPLAAEGDLGVTTL
eukprot:g764.t1